MISGIIKVEVREKDAIYVQSMMNELNLSLLNVKVYSTAKSALFPQPFNLFFSE